MDQGVTEAKVENNEFIFAENYLIETFSYTSSTIKGHSMKIWEKEGADDWKVIIKIFQMQPV